ncbi:hypothetical protein [Clostridium senegalense]|uniref:hypothetical protein n=1 Tax=Clostridium senegalense TaxID=1465809 RepID=UPI001C114EED|nr:hypothetical protein [Clostridium senegalense]MBU5226482.1 hypothetical protein [Clostridium senegalense]
MLFQNKEDIIEVIGKEKNLLKKYKRYLDSSTNPQSISVLNELIDKHSTHLETLNKFLNG